MGLIKGALLLIGGIPVRPTTTRERARGYQREANRLLAEGNDIALERQRLAGLQRLSETSTVVQVGSTN